jgi:hypothetical protein
MSNWAASQEAELTRGSEDYNAADAELRNLEDELLGLDDDDEEDTSKLDQEEMEELWRQAEYADTIVRGLGTDEQPANSFEQLQSALLTGGQATLPTAVRSSPDKGWFLANKVQLERLVHRRTKALQLVQAATSVASKAKWEVEYAKAVDALEAECTRCREDYWRHRRNRKN